MTKLANLQSWQGLTNWQVGHVGCFDYVKHSLSINQHRLACLTQLAGMTKLAKMTKFSKYDKLAEFSRLDKLIKFFLFKASDDAEISYPTKDLNLK